MTHYLTHFVRDALTNVELFRAAYMTRQVVGNARFGLDEVTLDERLVPSANRPLDDLEAKLVEAKGPGRACGRHPSASSGICDPHARCWGRHDYGIGPLHARWFEAQRRVFAAGGDHGDWGSCFERAQNGCAE
jgi:hypothetical protein